MRQRLSFALLCCVAATSSPLAQGRAPSTSVPRVVRLDGQFLPVNGLPVSAVETVTLSIYASLTDETPVWSETQDVHLGAQGRYTVFLGASTPAGLPARVLSAEARWLGIRFVRPGEEEQPRVPLTAVPYALRASDADTLGGLPPSAFLRSQNARDDASQTANGTSSLPSTTPRPAANTGTANFIGKFANSIDLTSSVIYESNGRIGVGSVLPLDTVHAKFTDSTGAFTGFAVQNLGSGAASYSGMLFYDQNGALGQFQGFNNSTHEYRINNIASGGTINFMIGSTSRFLVANNGNVTVNGSLGARGATVRGKDSFVASGTVTVSNTSNTVTGSGTAFLTELQVGDRLLMGVDSRPVTAIASDTSLTVSSAFPSNASGAATVFPVLFRLDNSTGVTQAHVNDQGNLQLGAVFSATPKLLVYQTNRFVGTSTTASYSNGNLVVATSGTGAVDTGGLIALGGNRGTTAGGATFAGVRGAKENGIDNDARGYLGLYTTDVGNTFAERARLSSTGNLGIGTSDPGQRIEVNGGVRLNTATARPTCDATVRGTFWVTQQGTGVDDTVEVCVKNAADAYVWRTVF